jgi:monothiol glutaredoxin
MSDVTKKIESQVANNKVVLYMKGNKEMPQCGFSAKVVQILNSYGVDYETVDVLADPEIRQGIKEYSSWPTLPQLYVDGNFIGGCDICVEMHESGELESILVDAVRE